MKFSFSGRCRSAGSLSATAGWGRVDVEGRLGQLFVLGRRRRRRRAARQMDIKWTAASGGGVIIAVVDRRRRAAAGRRRRRRRGRVSLRRAGRRRRCRPQQSGRIEPRSTASTPPTADQCASPSRSGGSIRVSSRPSLLACRQLVAQRSTSH